MIGSVSIAAENPSDRISGSAQTFMGFTPGSP
jgi:hypothetical protein